MILLFLLACTKTEDVSCECSTAQEQDAQALIHTYCTACHSSSLAENLRYGAPMAVDLDTMAGVHQWRERSAVRVWESKDMPPGGGISDEDRELLHQWFSCGAPGEEVVIPEIHAISYDHPSHIVVTTVNEFPSLENALLLRREVDFGGSDMNRVGVFSEELYYAEGSYAYLMGYIFYTYHGHVLRKVGFEPALPIFRPYDDWDIDVVMTIEEPSGVREESVHWVGTKRWSEAMDAQEFDLSPLEIRLVSDKGEEWGWHLSNDVSFSAQWVQFPDNTGWTALQDNIDLIPGFPNEFPLRSGLMWIERVVEE